MLWSDLVPWVGTSYRVKPEAYHLVLGDILLVKLITLFCLGQHCPRKMAMSSHIMSIL